MTYIIHKSNDLDLRQQISSALNEIEAVTDLVPNMMGGALATDWTIVTGTIVPVTGPVTYGDNPPTIASGVITINSAGTYRVMGVFAIDPNGANDVKIDVEVNGTPGGIPAGNHQSGGAGSTASQPMALHYFECDEGDTVQFMATASGTSYVRSIATGYTIQQQSFNKT